MYAPTPNDFDVLVALSKARGIDPLGVANLLLFESAGFDPAAANAAGAYGLNQMTTANLASLGITPADWTSRTAAAQLPTIFSFWDGLAKSFAAGSFPSTAALLEALNFLPARYKGTGAATNPNAQLAVQGASDGYYAANPALDPGKTGVITPTTIGQTLTNAQTSSRWPMLVAGVQAAQARAGASSTSPPVPPRGPVSPPSAASGRPSGFSLLLAGAITAVVIAGTRGVRLLLPASSGFAWGYAWPP